MADFFQTEEQRKAALQAGAMVSSQSLPNFTAPTIPPQTITGEALAPVPAPTVTPPPQAPIPSAANIAVTTPPAPAPQNDFEAALFGLEAKVTEFGSLPKLKETTVTQKTQPFQQQLDDINQQIRTHQLESMKAQEKALKMGETTGFARGEAAEVERQNAFEAFRLSSLSQALQGNILTATKQAEASVDLKFAQTEADIRTQRNNIIANYDSLTPAQKKRANATLLKIDAQDAFVKEQKEKSKEAQKTTLEYVGVATPLQLDEMSKLGSAIEVQQYAAGKGLKSLAQQKAEKDLKDKKFQFISQTENQAGGIFNPETGTFTPFVPTGQGGVVNQDDIIASNLPSEQKNATILTNLLKSKKIGQGTRTQLGNILGVINASEDLALIGQAGKFTGVSPSRALLDFRIPLPFTDLSIPLPFRQTFKRKGTATTEGYLEAINLKVQQWASGAALTELQTEQVARFTPRVTDTDTKVREKLNNLTNFMLTQAKSQLQSEGIDFKPQKVDLFESLDLLKKASPEQLKELKDAGLL